MENAPRKRLQMTLTPRVVAEGQEPAMCNDSTETVEGMENVYVKPNHEHSENSMNSTCNTEVGGLIVSDGDSISDLDLDEDEVLDGMERWDEKGPMRDDMDIVRTRWSSHEVDHLMVAVNVNRDAIKYFFDGPGGGKDVKRRAWKDVAGE